MRYTEHFNTKKTPQSEAIPGTDQVKNSAGGYSFQADCWTRLDRFLILGTEGGSYYASEKKLTIDSANSLLECIKNDGKRFVDRIVEISDAGRAPKNDPAIFALALASKLGDDATRRYARDAVPKVCRIGTHLFTFVENLESLGSGGWGRGTRNTIASWYNDMPVDRLALQVSKYQQRNGWSHRDLMRLAHPSTKDPQRNAIYKWVVKGAEGIGTDARFLEGGLIYGFERAKSAKDAKEVAGLIREYRLPHECVPTQFKDDPVVQEVLLEGMPMGAMIRNLGNLSKSGLLKPLSSAAGEVVRRLGDSDALRKARIHPIQVLAALLTYKSGHGVRGKGQWEPVQAVVNALDAAFYECFKHVVPTGKRFLIGLDVSGSMGGGSVAGVPGLTPAVAAACMAMAIARVEKNYELMAFKDRFTKIDINPRMSLDEIVGKTASLTFGGTDCSLPMIYAQEKGLTVDAFLVLTDNETWAGNIHPSQALKEYRRRSGIPAKSVVIGMVTNGFTIADPNDAGMMDVVGFDTAVPQLINDFVS